MSGIQIADDSTLVTDEFLPPHAILQSMSFFKTALSRLKSLRKKQLRDDDPLSEYEIIKMLGEGAQGRVDLALHRPTGTHVALKRTWKQDGVDGGPTFYDDRTYAQEVEIYHKVDRHPNIVDLLDHWTARDAYYTAFELASGGDVLSRLQGANKKCYSERDAAILVATAANALAFLHAHGIVHRDFRAGNVMFIEKGDDSSLVLVDFGIAGVVSKGRPLVANVGVPLYMAPEVYSGTGYGPLVDAWSLGVFAFNLISGSSPFLDGSDQMRGPKFSGRAWKRVSEECKDFVKRLLTVEQRSRMTTRECLDHTWIGKNVPKEVGSCPSCVSGVLRRPAGLTFFPPPNGAWFTTQVPCPAA
ncbi:kinase-like protein [Gonapodya prolifera JEL478]|uniref:Kinase-like protein n=1 Tax=Gonapodya prolifera (strain JEL478) TaxID=1344416 RepID=A0A139AH44_GONPJ|nr:kinase-like protein [Gonapodya prolifera JEL478]|eukprot:KXS16142.1 kinase-like protein [Gonapodya prolifera JEL478]